jgi:hypothetical protein
MGECRHSHNCPGTWRTEKSENFESEDTPYRRGVFGSRRAILESNMGQIFRTLPMGWALGAPCHRRQGRSQRGFPSTQKIRAEVWGPRP